tara:strand:- start:288 stop:542 length:255 start_codon:yes stop_codon:yes gene_type:complete
MSNINLNTLSSEANHALLKLDNTLIGTPNYMGIQYFWACDYKYMGVREASPFKLRRIHRLILEAGYAPSDVNETIENIIERVLA